jgi:hypothetical protein
VHRLEFRLPGFLNNWISFLLAGLMLVSTSMAYQTHFRDLRVVLGVPHTKFSTVAAQETELQRDMIIM